jgi:hypothetical protein
MTAVSDFTITRETFNHPHGIPYKTSVRFVVRGRDRAAIGSAPTRRRARRIVEDRIIVNRAQERRKAHQVMSAIDGLTVTKIGGDFDGASAQGWYVCEDGDPLYVRAGPFPTWSAGDLHRIDIAQRHRSPENDVPMEHNEYVHGCPGCEEEYGR